MPVAVNRALALRLAAVFGVAATAAAVAGAGAGSAVYFVVMADSSPTDPWAELGAAIFGVLAGLAVGVIAYAFVTIAGVRRLEPAGRRLRPAVALLALPPALCVLLGAVGGVAGML